MNSRALKDSYAFEKEAKASFWKSILAFALLLIPFFRPTIINDWNTIAVAKSIFAIWLLLSCLVIVYRFVSRNGRFEPFLVCLLAYCAITLVATLLSDGLRYDLLINSAMILAPALLVQSFDRNDIEPFLVAILVVIGLLVVSELLLRMVIPNGIYQIDGNRYWILERGSLQSRWCYLLVFVAATRDYVHKNKLGLCFLLTSLFSVLLVLTLESATSKVGLIIEICIMCLSGKSVIRRFATCRVVNIILLALFVGIVIFRVADYLPYDQLATFLGKDLTYSSGSTFTGRTYIWDSVIRSIAQAPIIGHGYQQYVATDMWQFYSEHNYGSAHDLWLQIGFTAGLSGIAVFLGVYLSACRVADCNSNKSYRAILSALIVAFMLTSIFENTLNSTLIFALAFASSRCLSEVLSEVVPDGSQR